MTTWLPDLAGFSGPKYQAVVDALAEAIKRGELRPGDRLPPQRKLAQTLGFDLTTITRAYDLAQQRGHIVANGRSGSFVRKGAMATIAATLQVDTGMNTPPMPGGGVVQHAYSLALHSVLDRPGATEFQYQGPGGSSEARRTGALLMERLGFASGADQVVVTAGGQNGLHAVMEATLKRGDRVACGKFVYPGFRTTARRMGIELVPIEHITADSLNQAAALGPLRALYCVPTNDNPTTATIPSSERKLIADVLRSKNIQLIEDDAYGLFDAKPFCPISSWAPELSWYILSTSKVLSPALRVAFVRAPSVGQALQLAADVHETAVMAPPLNTAIVALWLSDGTFDRLVSAVRSEAEWRLRLARSILDIESCASHECGYHIWLRLPEGVGATDLSHKLALAGVGSIPSDRFAVERTSEQALRISLGGVADRSGLELALRALEGHIASSRRAGETLV